jgi:hypothetical protein
MTGARLNELWKKLESFNLQRTLSHVNDNK